ncbi:hypothetical protein DL96DRAFT_1624079 [Flagelloscypha sp. PMI_526]|nr:hypothetical protein DL96DRAFT_1624079 [Flagelloscypha sp. PMI_526]
MAPTLHGPPEKPMPLNLAHSWIQIANRLTKPVTTNGDIDSVLSFLDQYQLEEISLMLPPITTSIKQLLQKPGTTKGTPSQQFGICAIRIYVVLAARFASGLRKHPEYPNADQDPDVVYGAMWLFTALENVAQTLWMTVSKSRPKSSDDYLGLVFQRLSLSVVSIHEELTRWQNAHRSVNPAEYDVIVKSLTAGSKLFSVASLLFLIYTSPSTTIKGPAVIMRRYLLNLSEGRSDVEGRIQHTVTFLSSLNPTAGEMSMNEMGIRILRGFREDILQTEVTSSLLEWQEYVIALVTIDSSILSPLPISIVDALVHSGWVFDSFRRTPIRNTAEQVGILWFEHTTPTQLMLLTCASVQRILDASFKVSSTPLQSILQLLDIPDIVLFVAKCLVATDKNDVGVSINPTRLPLLHELLTYLSDPPDDYESKDGRGKQRDSMRDYVKVTKLAKRKFSPVYWKTLLQLSTKDSPARVAWRKMGAVLSIDTVQNAECSFWRCVLSGQSTNQRLRECPCGEVQYCSRSCQKRDWKEGRHRESCRSRKRTNMSGLPT